MRLRWLVAAAALLSASLAARADTYNYSFTETQFGNTGNTTAVSFDEPAILTSPTRILAADFVSSSTTYPDSVSDVVIYPLYAEDCTGPPDSCVEVDFSGNDSAAAFFPGTNLTSVGVYTYNANGETATLTITDLSVPTSVTPEPSSIALLSTGLLGIAGVVRKRFA